MIEISDDLVSIRSTVTVQESSTGLSKILASGGRQSRKMATERI